MCMMSSILLLPSAPAWGRLEKADKPWPPFCKDLLCLHQVLRNIFFGKKRYISRMLQAARRALKRQRYLLALLITLRLKDQALQREVVLATPASEVTALSFFMLSQPYFLDSGPHDESGGVRCYRGQVGDANHRAINTSFSLAFAYFTQVFCIQQREPVWSCKDWR